MFAYLFRVLYQHLLQTDDDFFMRCRKAFITCAFVLGIVNILTNTFSTVTSKDVWTVVRILNCLMIYVASLIWIGSWIYAKLTCTSPDWLVNLDVDASLCLLVLMHFSSPNWGYHALCLTLAFAAVVIRTRYTNRFFISNKCI